MGREIRRVPPSWEHPKAENNLRGDYYQPLYDQTYESARAGWLEGLRKWEAGEDPDREKYRRDNGEPFDYWEWEGSPPDRDYYRPYSDDQQSWFQVYETVSEGTPVTPPFATEDELIDYLVNEGDFWQQSRWREGQRDIQPNPPGYSREVAEAFVKGSGWVPSMVVETKPDGSQVIKTGIETAEE